MLLRCRKRLQVAISRRMNEEGRDTLERLRLSPEDAENGQSNEPDLFVCFFSFVRLDLLCQVTVSSLHKTANNLRDSSYHNYFFLWLLLCYVMFTIEKQRRLKDGAGRTDHGANMEIKLLGRLSTTPPNAQIISELQIRNSKTLSLRVLLSFSLENSLSHQPISSLTPIAEKQFP